LKKKRIKNTKNKNKKREKGPYAWFGWTSASRPKKRSGGRSWSSLHNWASLFYLFKGWIASHPLLIFLKKNRGVASHALPLFW